MRRSVPAVLGGLAAAWVLVGCDLGTPGVTYDVPGTQLAAGDVNGDGHLDLFVGISGTTVTFMVNDGSGAFVQTQMEAPLVPSPGPSGTRTYALADANGDGLDDLLIGDVWAGQTTDGTTVWLELNDGDGFGAPTTAATDEHPKGWTGSISWNHGDVDGDDDLDVVLVNAGMERALVRLGDGAGGFTTGPTTAFPFRWYLKAQLVDVNADGLEDLVAPGTVLDGSLRGAVVVGLGDGTGAFPDPTSYPAIDRPEEDGIEALAVGDFDGDGDQDLVGALRANDPTIESLSVHLGNGDGTFAPATERAVGIEASSMAAADFDSDGHLDLLLTAPGKTKVLFGDGTAQFPRERNIGSAGRVVVAEVNGDTRPDAVFRDDGTMTVYLNGL